MKPGQFIRRANSVTLYLIVLYYLLPFRPVYLYYSAHHTLSDILLELKEKKNQIGNNLAFNEVFRHNSDTFPKKDQARFFFSGFIIPSPLSNGVAFVSKKEISHFLQSPYQNALVLFNSGRGPPLA